MSNHDTVLVFLETLIPTTPDKVYLSEGQSYTWAELRDEVAKGSEMGQRYVQSLVDCAGVEGKSLEQFLSTPAASVAPRSEKGE